VWKKSFSVRKPVVFSEEKLSSSEETVRFQGWRPTSQRAQENYGRWSAIVASGLAVMFRQWPERRPIKKPGGIRQAKGAQKGFVDFGNLAILLRESSQLKTHGFAPPPFGRVCLYRIPLTLFYSIRIVEWSLQRLFKRKGRAARFGAAGYLVTKFIKILQQGVELQGAASPACSWSRVEQAAKHSLDKAIDHRPGPDGALPGVQSRSYPYHATHAIHFIIF
jgi:hypothetical protein